MKPSILNRVVESATQYNKKQITKLQAIEILTNLKNQSRNKMEQHYIYTLLVDLGEQK